MGFAYFSMLEEEKKSSRRFINQLAGIRFRPKVKMPLDLGITGSQGFNLTLPLAPVHWRQLRPDSRQKIVARIHHLTERHGIDQLALHRSEKNLWQKCFPGYKLYFGDLFLKLLAAVLIKNILSRRAVRKLILIGGIGGYDKFLHYASRFEVPISLQNAFPAQLEVIQRRLLYEKGVAVSNSQLRPQDWQAKDLVVAFTDIRPLAALSPQAAYLMLDDASVGLAPALEKRLQAGGIRKSMAALAPILEGCLMQSSADTPSPEGSICERYDFLIRQGTAKGLWVPFLDN